MKGAWRIRYNGEMYKMYKDVALSTYIRLKRLIWAGQVVRMEQHGIPKKVLGRCHTEGCSQPAPDSELEGCSKR
jgi:hypothetical protein